METAIHDRTSFNRNKKRKWFTVSVKLVARESETEAAKFVAGGDAWNYALNLQETLKGDLYEYIAVS